MTAPSSLPFTPMLMTPDVLPHLQEEGYIVPDSWPFPARVAPEMNSRSGWQVKMIGEGKDEGVLVYIAPDGSKFCRATHGARPVLVGLSKRTSPAFLRVLPGSRRPKWVIEDTPKGEIPEALRAWLLQKGERLAKGESRKARALREEAEALLIEPSEPIKAGARGGAPKGYIKGAQAALGTRPSAKHPEERRAWDRRFYAWKKEQAVKAAAQGN